MGLLNRIFRVVRAQINSSSRIINNLVKPVPETHFDIEESPKILRRAVTFRDEYLSVLVYLKYLQKRKDFQSRRITLNELFEIAEDLDLPKNIIQTDLESWLESQRRRKKLKQHLINFLIFNSFTFLMNYSSSGSLSWSLYPALAWGAGLIVLTVNVHQNEAEEATNAFSKWLAHQKISKDTEQKVPATVTQANKDTEKEENLTNQKELNDKIQNSNYQHSQTNETVERQGGSVEFIAGEIQQLLNNLSERHPTNTKEEKQEVVIEALKQVQTNSILKEQINSAIDAGATEALKELINNPLANILLATLEGWNGSMDQQISSKEDLPDFWRE